MAEPANTAPPDELDLRHVIRILWEGKWIILGITFVAAVASVVAALLLPNIYRAEALLAPNDSPAQTGVAGILSQYPGLATLAGTGSLLPSVDKKTIGIEVLQSRKFITGFIDRRDLLVPLLAVKGWDPGSRELVIDPDLYDVHTGQWVRDVSPPTPVIPSPQEAYNAFSDLLNVGIDRKSGLVTVAVEHISPVIARQWVDWLVEDVNATLMQQDVTEAEQAIKYLNRQIEQTSLAGLQNVFFSLIEEQTKVVMLASLSPEYVFKTIDPAVVPEKKAKPRRSVIAVAGTLFGGMMALLFVLLRSRFSN